MPDTLGNINVPEIAASGTFPIVADYPFGRSSHPDVAIHQFGSGNAKIEQRFLLGEGAKRFTVRRAFLRDADRRALRDFWESKYGPYFKPNATRAVESVIAEPVGIVAGSALNRFEANRENCNG